MAHPRDRLVEQMVRRWRSAENRARPRNQPPCVAISRQPGAGAEALGRRVASQLGFDFFGIDLVDRIAREVGVEREQVAQLDEHVRSGVERFVVEGLGNRHPAFDEAAYRHQLVRTLSALSERGRAVVLGRGSPYLMPAARTLRLLVVGPWPDRVATIAERHGLSADEAEVRLTREETDRRKFLERLFRVDPDDASLYDLVVNPATLGPEQAAATVVDTLRHRFPDATVTGQPLRTGTSLLRPVPATP
jgi:cytidylate kinase